ncbi:hypothetical protein QUC31_018663 [Theobroma cacao]
MAAAFTSFYFLLCSCLALISLARAEDTDQFIYNGFVGANLHLDGNAKIHHNGILQLTNTSKQLAAHAFYPSPIKFNTSSPSTVRSLSFSTNFVIAMVPEWKDTSGHGIVFVISPSMDFSHAVESQYLGLFNTTNNGNSSNHIFAVEFDTILSPEFEDRNDNHVGIDVNGLKSIQSEPAAYFSNEERKNRSLKLISGHPIQVWVDYNDGEKLLNVTLAPMRSPKPDQPLLSTSVDLSDILLDTMYVGFSAATGSIASNHYILGWSFNRSGQARSLEISELPKLPKVGRRIKPDRLILIIAAGLLLVIITGATYFYRRKKYEEVYEAWEQEYGPQRFSYKTLYKATQGFRDKQLVGAGGFGKVYKGNYVVEEMVKVLKLGLLCSDPRPDRRPTIKEVVQYLDGNASLPDIPLDRAESKPSSILETLPLDSTETNLSVANNLASDCIISFSSSLGRGSLNSFSSTDTVLRNSRLCELPSLKPTLLLRPDDSRGNRFLHILVTLATVCSIALAKDQNQFIHEGFHEANLHLNGIAKIHPNGLLELTNSSYQQIGRAFFPLPIKFNTSSSNNSGSLSFSSSFVFAMVPEFPKLGGHGLAFTISPSMELTGAVASQYFGLFNTRTNGRSTNHVFAIELDTIKSPEFEDIDANHVGIDVNNLLSNASAPATYYSETEGKNKTLELISGKPIQVWIDYDEREMLLQVTLAPLRTKKPRRPLLSAKLDLSQVFLKYMYVGFSASTGAMSSNQYILGWSFNKSGQAQSLDYSKLPSPPHRRYPAKKVDFRIMVPLLIMSLLVIFFIGAAYKTWRKKYEEIREDWEQEYEPERPPEEIILVDWVLQFWKTDLILQTNDPRLEGNYVVTEMELVLKLGLLCAHPAPASRPSMSTVVQYLNGSASLPELLLDGASDCVITVPHQTSVNDMSFPASCDNFSANSLSSTTDSILSCGR